MYVLQVYSVRVRVNTDHVLGLLLEKEQFNIARKYAELVNSTKSQISIKEVISARLARFTLLRCTYFFDGSLTYIRSLC